MISDKVYQLCNGTETVSSLLAVDPELPPGEAWKKLYGGHAAGHKASEAVARDHRDKHAPEDLKRARDCGKWGTTEPSELFLQLYHDALCTLDHSVSNAMVSPPLMGSSGTIPLTVISVVPDIMRHMSNFIVKAEKEVFLATNYWIDSVASAYITNAMKELSRRAGERGERVVMKMLYDRGSPKQVIHNHYIVSEKEYRSKAVNIPAPEDIPNIDLQVMNYHRPALGTFHCKYMVVDRKYAVLQSNNIQDNDNLEMMTHLEGPIVDSLYDMALISWNLSLTPTLPSHDHPAIQGGLGVNEPVSSSHPDSKNTTSPTDPESVLHSVGDSHVRKGIEEQMAQIHITPAEHGNETQVQGARETARQMVSEGNTEASKPGPEHKKTQIVIPGPDEAVQRWLQAGKQDTSQSQIMHPSPTDGLLPEHLTDDPHYDADIADEVARVQTAVNPKPDHETRIQAVTRHLNHTRNVGFAGTAPDCAEGDEMTPYITHPTTQPFPIAMVCREPHGAPNHKSVYNPQNEVWLSALRNARKNVFIQSPTLNAEPLVPAIIEACERGIDVICYICLGYNDTGELLPMQGGTNEMVAHKLSTTLSAAGKQHLHWFWYIGKDQTVPIVAKKKKRDCHVKVMIVDEHIGIQGNGNQDTQSWFHSQEINVMFDSAHVCAAWIDGLRRNQNTHLYGQVSREDGIWRDAQGNQPQDVIGVDPGRFSWAKGFVGAVNRVRGTGDF
ncbi:iq calmodulin-binding motif protein [Calycina marina]|uniref:Iq calmodulin-binding motif protein n=1 Tax=Calycina marina TaxID=1763456 RepID=A0A9P8CDA7_9HELO|nr:iq calmodulin-binding motif protein [Calycina marina]